MGRFIIFIHGISVSRGKHWFSHTLHILKNDDTMKLIEWEHLADKDIGHITCLGDFIFDVLAVTDSDIRDYILSEINLYVAVSYSKIILVTHSLGTWLAYTILNRVNKEIDLWITLGSPLARIPLKLKKPKMVKSWVNVYSSLDSVTRQILPCRFTLGKISKADKNIHVWNKHSLENYLAQSKVKQLFV